ncbi:hypothetical protein ACFC1R_28570 [Kitasatospora sp. NPDC056138]|uniref:hypothetical protein n=1 Tax=Kitasatospora sp. NPDC056138 TaxID=3345724 RepID=UPI0035DE7E45
MTGQLVVVLLGVVLGVVVEPVAGGAPAETEPPGWGGNDVLPGAGGRVTLARGLLGCGREFAGEERGAAVAEGPEVALGLVAGTAGGPGAGAGPGPAARATSTTTVPHRPASPPATASARRRRRRRPRTAITRTFAGAASCSAELAARRSAAVTGSLLSGITVLPGE